MANTEILVLQLFVFNFKGCLALKAIYFFKQDKRKKDVLELINLCIERTAHRYLCVYICVYAYGCTRVRNFYKHNICKTDILH